MDASSTSPAEMVKGLAPAFTAGFAVQQAVEVISSGLAFNQRLDNDVKIKKAILSVIALVISAGFVIQSGFDLLAHFWGSEPGQASSTHVLITIIFISAGTEGLDSLLKWMSYKKEETKAAAAGKKHALPNGDNGALKKMPS